MRKVTTNIIHLVIIAGGLLTPVFEGWSQEIHYISDNFLVPVRSGAGNNFRIVNRGIPSATSLTIISTNDNGDWTEIETAGGTRGWVPSQFVQKDPPAGLLINDLRVKLQQIQRERDKATAELDERNSEASESTIIISELRSTLNETQLKFEKLQETESQLSSQFSESKDAIRNSDEMVNRLQSELEKTRGEFHELKRVSAAAMELDLMNEQLVAELESGRSESDLLRLENIRLREQIRSNQLLDGALAVLLGGLIAVLIPRMWPKRRKPSDWA